MKVLCIILFVVLLINTQEKNESTAIITALNGDIKITKGADKQAVFANILDGLFDGDILEIGQESEATILYRNGKILAIGGLRSFAVMRASSDTMKEGQEIESKMSEEVLTVFAPLFLVGEGNEKIARKPLVRAPEDSLDLVIYEPGNTALSTKRPDVFWGSYPDANWYTVIFQKKGEVIISIATTDTICPYPKQNDELESGKYLLKVIALRNNDVLRTSQRFVTILQDDESKRIKDLTDKITAQTPDKFTVNLLKAMNYTRFFRFAT